MSLGLLQAFLGLGGLCRHLGAGQGMALPSKKATTTSPPSKLAPARHFGLH